MNLILKSLIQNRRKLNLFSWQLNRLMIKSLKFTSTRYLFYIYLYMWPKTTGPHQIPKTTQINFRSRNTQHTWNPKQKYATCRNITHISNQNTCRYTDVHLRQQNHHFPDPISYNHSNSTFNQNCNQHFLAPNKRYQDTGWNLVIRKNQR